jgi:hypothetical protein
MMLFRRVGRVVVGFHDTAAPTDDEWRGWVEACRAAMSDGGVGVVQSLGGAPSPSQRAILGEAFGKGKFRTAVLTQSALSRGVVTAVSWLGVPVRAYAFGEMHKVQEYLRLSADEVTEVSAVLREFMGQIKQVASAR